MCLNPCTYTIAANVSIICCFLMPVCVCVTLTLAALLSTLSGPLGPLPMHRARCNRNNIGILVDTFIAIKWIIPRRNAAPCVCGAAIQLVRSDMERHLREEMEWKDHEMKFV